MKKLLHALFALSFFLTLTAAHAAQVTVPAQDTRVVFAVGGTPDATFDIPFTFYANADIEVYVDGVELDPADFTVTGNAGTTQGYEGGLVTLDTPVSDATVVVNLNIALERTTNFPVSADFNITSLNTQNNKLVSMIQLVDDKVKRALKLPATSGLVDGDGDVLDLQWIEDPEDGKVSVYDATQRGFVNGPDADEIEDAQASATAAAASALAATNSASDASDAAADAADAAADAAATLGKFASTSTDNAVPRFDGVAGAMQNSGIIIDDTTNTMHPATNDVGALGTATLQWSDAFLASGAVVNFNNGDVTWTHSADTLTLGGGNLALGSNSLTMTGSLAATGARVTKGWFTDVESTNCPTIGGTSCTGTGGIVRATAPTFSGTITAGGVSLGGTTITAFAEGTYTPTLTNTTNVSSSTAAVTNFMRINNTVTVWGSVNITPTANTTLTLLGMSLPPSHTSNFAAAEDAGGTSAMIANAEGGFAILADTTNDRVSFRGISSSTSATAHTFSFTYKVLP